MDAESGQMSGLIPTPKEGCDYTTVANAKLMALLKERALDCGQKSMTARLAGAIDLVEMVLARGYDRSQVRDLLIEAGWHFTPDSFDSALSRVRRWRKANAGSNPGISEKSVSSDSSHSGTQLKDLLSHTRRKWDGSS